MIDGVQRAFVVDLAPSELKATALGVFHTVTGLAALPAGLIARSLWDMCSQKTTFIYGFVLSAIAVVLFKNWLCFRGLLSAGDGNKLGSIFTRTQHSFSYDS